MASHQISDVSITGHAIAHLGDTHHHYHPAPASNQLIPRTKKCGLCLGGAPKIESNLFQGRATDLEEMQLYLSSSERSVGRRCLVLGGFGGIGKTQLALAYGDRYRDFYDSVFWLNATSEATLTLSFRDIAAQIFQNQDLHKFEDGQILFAVRQWLSNLDNKRWLLIYDNFDDPDLYDIEKYYPSVDQGSIVVTSRLPERVNGQHMRLGVLSDVKESLRILQTRSKRPDIELDAHAVQLAERLAGLPLALATAGAYLKTSIWTFQQYLEEYEKRWNINPRMPARLPEYKDRTLYMTWNISFGQLEKQFPEASQLLRLLAYFDNQKLWHSLFQAGTTDTLPEWLYRLCVDEAEFENLMGVLASFCFVEVHAAARSYSIHNTVHDWTLAVLNAAIDDSSYIFALKCVARSIVAKDVYVLGQLSYSTLAAHAARLECSRFSQVSLPGRDESLYHDTLRIAQLLRYQGRLEMAGALYMRLFKTAERNLGPHHVLTFRAIYGLGGVYHDQKQYDKATEYCSQILAARGKHLSSNHYLVLLTLEVLGLNHLAQDNFDEAAKCVLEALSRYKALYGPLHLETLRVSGILGTVYSRQDEVEKAVDICLRVVAGYEKLLGRDHPSTLNASYNLGCMYLRQHKYDEALKIFMPILVIYEKMFGLDHRLTINARFSLGQSYIGQNEFESAKEMLLLALNSSEKLLGGRDFDTLQTVEDLGFVYYSLGQVDMAEKEYVRALEGYSKLFGAGHTHTLGVKEKLDKIRRGRERLTDAGSYNDDDASMSIPS